VYGNAIVTGGTGTLGLEVCHTLLEHGLSGLATFNANPAQSETLVKSLRDRSPERAIEVLQVDVTDKQAVQEATEIAPLTICCAWAASLVVSPLSTSLRFNGAASCKSTLLVPLSSHKWTPDI